MTADEMKRLLDEMRQEEDAAHAETRRHFDQTADRLAAENRRFFEISTEATKHQIGFIAERVAQFDEKLDRNTGEIQEEIKRTAAETQAMIKFSHAEDSSAGNRLLLRS